VVCLSEAPDEDGSQASVSGQAALLVAQLRERVAQLREALQHRQDLAEEMTHEVHRQYERNLDLTEEVRQQHALNIELAEEIRRQDASNQDLAETLRREAANAKRCAKQYVELEREIQEIRRNPLRLLMRRRKGAE
jgi:hypothetical protein